MTRISRLLIIDDGLDEAPAGGKQSRRMIYEKLRPEFDLHFVENAAEIPKEIGGHAFDAVLVDFVLENWGITCADVIEQSADLAPVFLVSQSWHANFEELSSTVSDFPIARLFTWDQLETPKALDVVKFWISSGIRSHSGLSGLDCGSNDPLRLVQFSDMQFNARDEKAFEADTRVATQQVRSIWGGSPNFLALPGDIAEAGRPIEYGMAKEWVSKVAHRLAGVGGQIDVMTAPGNHDVCWPLALSQRIDTSALKLLGADKEPLFPDLSGYAMEPFRKFSQDIESEERWGSGKPYWVSGAYRSLGLIFFGLNTSEDLDAKGLPTRKILDATLASLFEEICDYRSTNPKALVVGLMHHPLDNSDETIANVADFKRNLSEATGPIVLLTGHVHEETVNLNSSGSRPDILQIGSSTFTLASRKRPEDSLRGFNMIEFKRRDDVVTDIIVTPYAIIGHRLNMQPVTRHRFQGLRFAVES